MIGWNDYALEQHQLRQDADDKQFNAIIKETQQYLNGKDAYEDFCEYLSTNGLSLREAILDGAEGLHGHIKEWLFDNDCLADEDYKDEVFEHLDLSKIESAVLAEVRNAKIQDS